MNDEQWLTVSTWVIDITLLATVAFTVIMIADCVRELLV